SMCGGRRRLALPPPALQNRHVIRPLVGGGVGAAQEAHAPLHLFQRLVFALLQPEGEVAAQVVQMLGTVPQESGDDLHGVGPAITRSRASSAVGMPPVTASEAWTRPERMASQRRRSSSSEESERRSVGATSRVSTSMSG